MEFFAILDQVMELLRQRHRVTYRALQLQFQLDDASLAVLKEELLTAQRVAVDENGVVLVWVGHVGTWAVVRQWPCHRRSPRRRVLLLQRTCPPSHLPPLGRCLLTPNAASSLSCSAIWSIRPAWQACLIPKTYGR